MEIIMTKKELQFEDLGVSLSELYEQMGYGEAVPDEATVRETENILAEVDRYCMPEIRKTVELKCASLGDDSVLYGALSLIEENG